MGPIAGFGGLASGVQWYDLVDQIVATERVRRVDPLTQQVGLGQRRIDAWTAFRGLVTRMEDAARRLRDGSAFDVFTASGGTSALSGRALLTASAGSQAAPGSYTVEVQQLARAEKLASQAVAATSVPLSELDPSFTGGSFTLNGREITIAAGDTLNQVRTKINAANTGADASGVGATILTVAPGEHRLVLTASATGAAGIRLDDPDGVLGRLGIGTGSHSVGVDDPTSPLAAVLGLTSPPEVRTIVIDGREVTVDLANDSLQGLLNKVRAAAAAQGQDPEAAARLVSEGGTTRLEVRGSVSSQVDDEATRQILGALGFSRDGLANAGTNAAVRIDGFDITRATNTIGDVLPGLTLALQQAEAGTTVEVTVARDFDAAAEAVKDFAKAYNDLLRFVGDQRGEGKPLAGNSTLRTAMASFTNLLLTPIDGLEAGFDRAGALGIAPSRTGELKVDETRLKELLATNPADVRALFTGRGGESPVDGLGGRFLAAATQITRSGDGTVARQLDTLNQFITSLNRRIADAETRLETRRESLILQFARMEEAMSQLQAQGSWLMSQVQALQPPRR